MTFLEAISNVLMNSDDEVRISIKKAGDDVRVLITPVLGEAPSKLSDTQSAIRSALSQPLLQKGNPTAVEAELVEYMKSYIPARKKAVDALSALTEVVADAPEAKSSKASYEPVTKPEASGEDQKAPDQAEEKDEQGTQSLFGGEL